MNDNDEKVIDVRVVNHQMRRGKLDQAALDAYLDTLPDEASEGEPTRTRFTTPFADRSQKH